VITPEPRKPHDDEREDEDDDDDDEHLHPTRCRPMPVHVRHADFLRDNMSLCDHYVVSPAVRILAGVPRLWNETIDAHRREVQDAILETTAALAAERGLLSVTMSQIAEQAGIGRATLYKYFSDVEAIVLAWHERQIAGHLRHLAQVGRRAGKAPERLQAVLEAYARIAHESHRHHDAELAAFLHRDKRVGRAQRQVHAMIRELVAEGAETGEFRDDVSPDELASYCLHALSAARTLPSKAAVRRLVTVTLTGLRPPPR
jgi:AcrR family transcriptional regulator